MDEGSALDDKQTLDSLVTSANEAFAKMQELMKFIKSAEDVIKLGTGQPLERSGFDAINELYERITGFRRSIRGDKIDRLMRYEESLKVSLRDRQNQMCLLERKLVEAKLQCERSLVAQANLLAQKLKAFLATTN